ncbi:putative Bromodomain containing protein [Monocercomonoides exilis]|uniref:putative Bromodomain containing protein n=1 Tax=Monocercomonoides exilis TaxID=2049356 RepID=UPI0035598350|nr:putative Bromodomain containing protein [Monocercomonoides exilis]|eukprot:MONOS_1313.1-p1 / transcript=MONOS_1313.1 / gene=MONOS_1313 / organism=Monocercomonoides_exilis_PA203 / gene_product=Bromodomain containing protein / transcript_product=Bromodomain containing protein / location=Mono_scaffold00022:168338-169567(+) / protein_length=343 / sequence_SO=supercontig / SO=protein_coding / is_pseudo=false
MSYQSSADKKKTREDVRQDDFPGATTMSTGSRSTSSISALQPNNLELIKFFKRAIQRLLKHQYAYPFAAPVDVKGLDIPDYPLIIKHPMDLGTIKSNLDHGIYDTNYSKCLDDIYLVWDNCYHYNPPDSDVSKMAVTLQKVFVSFCESSGLLTTEELRRVSATNPHKYFKPQSSTTGASLTSTRVATDKKGHIAQQLPIIKPNLDELLNRFEGDDKPMTMEEKEKLFHHIKHLPEKFLEKIVEFIQHISPHTGVEVEDEVLEFDIDDFEPRVQRNLEKYVKTCIEHIEAATKMQRQQFSEKQQPTQSAQTNEQQQSNENKVESSSTEQKINTPAETVPLSSTS